MQPFLLFALLIASTVAAPQYGGPVPAAGQGTGGSRAQAENPPKQQHQAPSAGSSVRCRTEYTTAWTTEYVETEQEVCNTVYVNECSTLYKKECFNVPRQECTTVTDRQCKTVYNDVCVEKYRTEYEDYTETECNTEYKDDCEYHWEGEGAAKVWVPIEGTCKSNPYDTCADVKKQRERQVPYPVCNKVPEQQCVNVPKKECRTVQDEECTNEPYQQCDQVPKEDCNTVHKKVPNRISQRVAKKVCDDGSGSGYGAENFGADSISIRSSEAIQFE